MPSYIRLLTEKPGNIATPPLGHTALYASSGTAGENKYELYIKNEFRKRNKCIYFDFITCT